MIASGESAASAILNLLIDDAVGHFPDLVTNGAFSSDTGWTKGDGWSIGAGVATSDGTQTAVSDLSQAVAADLIEGVEYSVTFALVASAGTITPIIGGVAGDAQDTTGAIDVDIVAGADETIVLRASADFEGTVDDVIVIPNTGSGTLTGTVTVLWVNNG